MGAGGLRAVRAPARVGAGLPLTDVEAIRDEIDLARTAAEAEPDHDPADGEEPAAGLTAPETRRVRPGVPPESAEVRAGFARIAAALAAR